MGCKSSKVKNAETCDPAQSKAAVGSTGGDQKWSGSHAVDNEADANDLSPLVDTGDECEMHVEDGNSEPPKMDPPKLWTAAETEEGVPKECSPFEGKWRDVGVVTGTMLLDWKGDSHELTISSPFAVSLEVSGSKFNGRLENNTVVWDDGDVWMRHDDLVACPGNLYQGQQIEVVGGCCARARLGTVRIVRTDGSVAVEMDDEGENEIVAVDDICQKLRNPKVPKRGWTDCGSGNKNKDILPEGEIQDEPTMAICSFAS